MSLRSIPLVCFSTVYMTIGEISPGAGVPFAGLLHVPTDMELIGDKKLSFNLHAGGRHKTFLYPLLKHGQQVDFPRSFKVLFSSAELSHVPR